MYSKEKCLQISGRAGWSRTVYKQWDRQKDSPDIPAP